MRQTTYPQLNSTHGTSFSQLSELSCRTLTGNAAAQKARSPRRGKLSQHKAAHGKKVFEVESTIPQNREQLCADRTRIHEPANAGMTCATLTLQRVGSHRWRASARPRWLPVSRKKESSGQREVRSGSATEALARVRPKAARGELKNHGGGKSKPGRELREREKRSRTG